MNSMSNEAGSRTTRPSFSEGHDMKRIWLAVAAAVGLLTAAGVSRADFGGPPPVMQAGGPVAPQAAENTANRYGILPFFRQVVWWKKAPSGCVGAGCGNTMSGGPRVGGYAPPMAMPYGGQPQGTLVFPNHQFNRSPRDFFMWEK